MSATTSGPVASVPATAAPTAVAAAAAAPPPPPPLTPLETVWTQLWSSLPSINAVAVEARHDAAAASVDISQFIAAVHRAAHANTNEAESVAAAATQLGAKGDQVSYTFAVFQKTVEEALLAWAPHLTPVTVERLEALRESIVDDRAPQAMVPLAAVMALPTAKVIATTIGEFVHHTVHPTYAPVYDEIWSALPKADAENLVAEKDFARMYAQLLKYAYSNATTRRAEVAARTVFLNAIAPTCATHLSFTIFRLTLQREARIHLDIDEPDSGVQRWFAFLKSQTGSPWDCQFVSPAVRGALVDPEANFVPSSLDADAAFDTVYRTPTANRVLICGHGRRVGALSAALAKALNAVNVDINELAIQAVDVDADEIGAKIRQRIAQGKPVDLSIQALLVARCLGSPATQHRGYVVGGHFPLSTLETLGDVEAFVDAAGLAKGTPPQAIVRLVPPPQSDDWMHFLEQEVADELALETKLRQDEADAETKKQQAATDKAERIRKREVRAERRAKIDAGELQATDEDAPDAVLDEPEPEEAPELDENGNPLEPEQIAARNSAKAAAVSRRRLLFDLRSAIRAGQPALPATVSRLMESIKLPSFQRVFEVANARRNVVAVAESDATVATTAPFLVSELRLVASVLPQEPALQPADVEGIENTPDGDTTLGELKLRTMTEQGIQLSPFQAWCPVTKLEKGVLVTGSWAFSCHYRGFMYCFTSKNRLQRFLASPHIFLVQELVSRQAAFIVARGPQVLQDAKLDASDIERRMAARLNLTLVSLSDFDDIWTKMLDEKQRRATLLDSRKIADLKTSTAREERRKKQREAEAKKKKATDKKPAKKAEKKGDDDDDKPDEAAQAVPVAATEEEVVKVVSTEERLAKEVEDSVASQTLQFPPLLVSALVSGLSDGACDRIVARGVVPQQVVVLEYTKPLLPDEEPPIEEEEPEEEAPPPPADPDDPESVAAAAAAAAKAKKPFDPADPKQCRKVVLKLVDKVTATPDDGKPPLAAVTTLNVFGASNADVASAVAHAVNKLSSKCVPPQDGEELIVDAEEEPADETSLAPPPNPALRPGKRAVHQFGSTKRFCPVTLLKQRTLVIGDPNYWLTYKGSRFLFASQNALDEFKQDPARYLPAPPSANPSWQSQTMPPPRIWVLGVSSAGKRTIANELRRAHGISPFSLRPEFLRDFAAIATIGGRLDAFDIDVPKAQGNVALEKATGILRRLDQTEADEKANIEKKNATLAAQAAREAAIEAGEEVDDIDEEEDAANAKILEFEPEEVEVKQERVAKAMREVAALLIFVEPFASSGYALVGEPATDAEATHLMDLGMIPEIVVNVKLSTEAFVARSLNAVVLARTSAREAKLALLKKAKSARLVKQREIELKKWRRRNLAQDDDAAEEEAGDEEDEEPEAVTVEGIKDELGATFDTENGNVGQVVAVFADRRVPVVEVNGDLGKDTVWRFIEGELSLNLRHRQSLLEAPMVVTHEAALELIRSGSKLLTSFRFDDPVALARRREGVPESLAWRPAGRVIAGEALIPPPPPPVVKEKIIRMVKTTNEDGEEVEVPEAEPEPEEEAVEEPVEDDEVEPEPELSPDELEEMTKELEAKRKKATDATLPRACVLRNRVYFFSNDATLKLFLDHPLRYWSQPPPLRKESTVVAVLEKEPAVPLPGGSRNMAHHLAFNAGAVYIDLSKLTRWGLDRTDMPTLKDECTRVIFEGGAMTDWAVGQLLCLRLHSVDVLQQGAVLFNLPRSPKQVEMLLARGLAIHKVISYVGEKSEAMQALERNARIFSLMTARPYSNAALVEIKAAWNSSESRRQSLSHAKATGFPARLHDTATSETVFRSCLSAFREYCPFMWSKHEELLDVGDLRTYAALHCGTVYHFSNEDLLRQFLEHPERLTGEIPPKPRAVPTSLPLRTSKQPVSACELCGCCPVVLFDTRDNKGLRGVTEPKAVAGRDDFTVQYESKYYRLSSAAALERFLRRPWVFVHGASLPAATRLPVGDDHLQKSPAEEFIARALYENVARALIAAEKTRPKFPGLDAHDSCLKFIALHLKANNPLNTEHRQDVFGRHLGDFTQRATLYKSITVDAPAEGTEEARLYEDRCRAWDAVQDDLNGHTEYGTLKRTALPPSS